MELLNSSAGAALIGLIPFVIFGIFWFGIISHLTKASGLRDLQSIYPLQGKPGRNFKRLKVKSGRMKRVRFNRMLRLDLSDECLIIRFIMPFSLNFSGVQIPLSEVKHIGTRGKWIFKYNLFTIAEHPIELYGNTKQIIAHLPSTESTQNQSEI